MPKVSILTTCFNREAFLGECIESVQQSKYQDYEHIIVDDSSSDASVAIARRYASEDSRIKVFINESNLGDYPNRQRAAELASGTYIKYLDADDKHGKWILDVMVDAMESFPEAGLGLLNSRPPYPNPSPFPELIPPEQLLHLYFEGKTNMMNRSPLGAIINRQKFLDCGGFSGKRIVGDFELWMKMSRTHAVVAIPHMLAMWRSHNQQENKIHKSDPIWDFRYLLVQREQLNHQWHTIDNKQRIRHLKFCEGRVSTMIARNIVISGPSKANQMRLEAQLSWSQIFASLLTKRKSL